VHSNQELSRLDPHHRAISKERRVAMGSIAGKTGRVVIITAMFAGLAAGAGAGSVWASTNTIAIPVIQLTPAIGQPGSSVLARGSSFGCAATVFLYWEYRSPVAELLAGTATVTQGQFSASITVPRDARDGQARVLATSTAPGCSAKATFTVCRLCQSAPPLSAWRAAS
jgi:hypothetical protein